MANPIHPSPHNLRFSFFGLVFLLLSLPFLSLLTKKVNSPQNLDSRAATLSLSEISRIGVGVHSHTPADYLQWYNYRPLNLGWYFTWTYNYVADFLPGHGPQFFPMIYGAVCDNTFKNYISANLSKFPAGTTFFVGNEVYEQGTKADTTQNYAVAYHDCYQVIKAINPNYKVAIAAMRSAANTAFYEDFRYHYKRNYGIYPPIDVYRVNIYSGNLSFFDGQVRQVRQKMKDWGDQNKALIVTESCARGSSTDQNAAYIPQIFDYLTGSASTDSSLGQASDGYKMVQKFGWFSLNSNRIYPECSLFNPSQHSAPSPPPLRSQLTSAGTAFVAWMASHAPVSSPTATPTSTSTPTPTKTPTPVPSIPLTCQSLQSSGTQALGQTLNLTCRSNISAHHFDFRILFQNGTTADIGSVLAQNNAGTLNYTLAHIGCYNFQCRVCAVPGSSACTPWDEL